MSATKALFKKELTEQWRTSRIIILGAAFLFLGMSGPVSLKLLPQLLKNATNAQGFSITLTRQFTASDYALNFFSQLTVLPVLILILVVMGTLAGERERGTQVFVLTKPVSRAQFILTKYFSYLLTVSGVLLVTLAAGLYYSILLSDGGSLAIGSFCLIGLAVLSDFAFITALVVLCSSLFNSAVAAGGVSFLAYEVFTLLSNLLPGDTAKYLPQNFLGSAQSLLTGQGDPTALWIATLVGVILAAVLLGLACWLAEQRELL